jgi:hypothetical protein
MDSYDNLPDAEIKPVGEISKKFIELGIKTFKEACNYVHDSKYGYNSNYNDKMIFFKEKMASCTMKHATIASLAEELNIPLYKYVGVYKFTEEITTGVGEITKKYKIPYVPMVHCFLIYGDYRFDLTEGNYNGKKRSIEEFIQIEKVHPFISRTEEYKLFKRILKNQILPSKDMEGINERTLLKAREESIKLLKDCIKK